MLDNVVQMLYEGDTRSRWRDGQVCPDVDKELWRLGPGRLREKGDRRKRERVEGKRAGKDEGCSFWEAERRIPEFCSVMLTRESKTRMRDNALRTGRRDKLWSKRLQNGGYHTG
ncbi:hypothetical protein TNCV_3516751 [Trichonephila clavipes]|nr:hypothetical protein TNCV_3516751 [Trichonephila clavipes]